MPDKKPRPYAEKGARLKARRVQLQNSSVPPLKLVEVAKRFGVSVSALGQWERGETWITSKHKPKVTAALGWTEAELDHGPAAGERRNDDMAYHPVSQRELEVLALFRALGTEQDEFVHKLKARVAARQTLQQNVRGDLRATPDAVVRSRMPVTARRPTKRHP